MFPGYRIYEEEDIPCFLRIYRGILSTMESRTWYLFEQMWAVVKNKLTWLFQIYWSAVVRTRSFFVC